MKKFIRRYLRSRAKKIYPRVPVWHSWSKARQRGYLQDYAKSQEDRAQRYMLRNNELRKRLRELEEVR